VWRSMNTTHTNVRPERFNNFLEPLQISGLSRVG
jgi:hypothetical protein